MEYDKKCDQEVKMDNEITSSQFYFTDDEEAVFQPFTQSILESDSEEEQVRKQSSFERVSLRNISYTEIVSLSCPTYNVQVGFESSFERVS